MRLNYGEIFHNKNSQKHNKNRVKVFVIITKSFC